MQVVAPSVAMQTEPNRAIHVKPAYVLSTGGMSTNGRLGGGAFFDGAAPGGRPPSGGPPGGGGWSAGAFTALFPAIPCGVVIAPSPFMGGGAFLGTPGGAGAILAGGCFILGASPLNGGGALKPPTGGGGWIVAVGDAATVVGAGICISQPCSTRVALAFTGGGALRGASFNILGGGGMAVVVGGPDAGGSGLPREPTNGCGMDGSGGVDVPAATCVAVAEGCAPEDGQDVCATGVDTSDSGNPGGANAGGVNICTESVAVGRRSCIGCCSNRSCCCCDDGCKGNWCCDCSGKPCVGWPWARRSAVAAACALFSATRSSSLACSKAANNWRCCSAALSPASLSCKKHR
mmetsp:Transcript_109511/g.349360  ORF Transcript_109511/g.349360 Transcript_109511/m.349360 type:complete len:348 (+) Transcript_109511:377-1420(+)